MKKILTLLLLTATFAVNAQQFDLTKEGYKPAVVELQGKSTEQIYTGIIKYINKNYKNPNEVLKGDIKNEYVRFDGHQKRMWCYKSLGIQSCTDQSYSVELDIKDGKLRMSFFPTQGFVAGTANKLMYNYETFFKKDGSLRDMYSTSKVSMDVAANDILNSIVDEINGKTSSNNDW